jgi:hypothetical protein
MAVISTLAIALSNPILAALGLLIMIVSGYKFACIAGRDDIFDIEGLKAKQKKRITLLFSFWTGLLPVSFFILFQYIGYPK